MTDLMSPPACEPARFRALMGRFATGVAVLTFRQGDTIAGTTINAFMSVSLEPQLVLVSMRTGGKFDLNVDIGDLYGISLLNGDQQALSGHFAGKPIDGLSDPLEFLEETPVIRDALVQMVVRVRDIHKAGDHTLYVSEVRQLSGGGATDSALLFYAGHYSRL